MAGGGVRTAWRVRARSLRRDELGESAARTLRHGEEQPTRRQRRSAGLGWGVWVGDFAFPVGNEKFWVRDLFHVHDLN